ncbi:uncharacterized protein EV420DRAFT_1507837 [Desarmillaria tabescens]|uniref:D-xylose 1-dehydrogenase (NADP(+), D-xylono-1,5-lactone-forming) n=1 Tax=Armillaria tabescens TaxID=1929756 RepID=A0AA39NKF9_ARMTA|nr:uncharacterized protein EV420DRAFT_1507837 [Desarmillaria tabescens]KAK0467237.1 hypothetical protein EV420DRAFT_1507837 [Desarmillaria tabescens]
MATTEPLTSAFVKDLLVDPKTRDVHDLIHKVVAVGSRTTEKAQEFINTNAGGASSIKAYGSYEEVYADKDVDAVYIGTPHTYHYLNALDAIKAGKHVLCEKPVTSNGHELRALLSAADDQGVFFMEAVWTRFQPLSLEVKKLIDGGTLGPPVVLQADLSGNFNIQNIPKTHRILDPALGGGALLDLGPYPLVWAIMALYEHHDNKLSVPSVSASMLKTPLTGVDSNTSFTLTFDAANLRAQAVLSCSINLSPINPGVTIRFERGIIKISPPIYCPKEYTVEYFDDKGSLPIHGLCQVGWHFEADEVARCVRDGKNQSSLWGHNKSLLEMGIFDEEDTRFPPGVEKVVE